MNFVIKNMLISLFLMHSFSGNSQADTCIKAIHDIDISFQKKSVFLNNSARKKLDSAALIINKHPDCKIVVGGYGSSCETCAQISWDRTFSVTMYLKQKGIDSTRMIFYYGEDEGDPLMVSIRGAADGEDGPAMIPAPHPCYSYHRLTKHRCKNLHK